MILLLLLATVVVEALLYIPLVWRYRMVPAAMVAASLPGLATALLLQQPGWAALFISIVSAVRWLNMARIIRGRRSQEYLLRSCRETGVNTLLLTGIGMALLVAAPPRLSLPGILVACAGVQALIAVVVAVSTIDSLRRAAPPHVTSFIPDKDLPTVSVAIPARNETQDLAECLESLLASEYPKLEILVLDDCSQDRTPEVIKSFAHDGVRFVQGEEPDSHWLAKNLAYQRLADESTGKYMLFCGVDVQLGPRAINALVQSMASSKAAMASVLPVRTRQASQAALVQPLRYWWELAVPRRFVGRPAVLSTCWIIERQALIDHGGFQAMSRAIIPEAILARVLQKAGAYRFWRAGDDLQVETHKSLAEQRATAIRVRYPQLHKHMELAVILALFEALILLGTVPLAVMSVLQSQWLAAVLATGAYSMLLVTHIVITRSTNPRHTLYAAFTFPAALLSELYLGVTSMLKYEFSHVDWKDRDVCVPVMRVIPRLPDM